jgi:hypothetical protein
VIVLTACFVRLPANVIVIVPMPLLTVPAAVVTPPVPMFVSASSAASMFAMSVASVALHVIGAVTCPSNASLNVPPVGVPPMVSVWTSSCQRPACPRSRGAHRLRLR